MSRVFIVDNLLTVIFNKSYTVVIVYNKDNNRSITWYNNFFRFTVTKYRHKIRYTIHYYSSNYLTTKHIQSRISVMQSRKH